VCDALPEECAGHVWWFGIFRKVLCRGNYVLSHWLAIRAPQLLNEAPLPPLQREPAEKHRLAFQLALGDYVIARWQHHRDAVVTGVIVVVHHPHVGNLRWQQQLDWEQPVQLGIGVQRARRDVVVSWPVRRASYVFSFRTESFLTFPLPRPLWVIVPKQLVEANACNGLLQVFFKENVRWPVWAFKGTKNFQYCHFIIVIGVSVQMFPLIIFSDSMNRIFNSRDPNRA